MNEQHQATQNYALFSRGMSAVMIAQFLSAMADNALLFAAIALLRLNHAPEWLTPVLQEVFAFAFIILAPFVGPFADAHPKGRVMLIANTMKFLGAAAMLAGLNPLLAYNLVGIGAAAYSPAKYGILGEMVGPDKLVKANSLMEGSTIVAILLGAVLGGVLADWSVSGALAAVAACYLLAAVANLFIPKLPAAHPIERFSFIETIKEFWGALLTLIKYPDVRFTLMGRLPPAHRVERFVFIQRLKAFWESLYTLMRNPDARFTLMGKLLPAHSAERFAFMPLIKDFWNSLLILMKNPDARFTLIGTSVFWGTGSTLRFLLVAWVPAALLIMDNQTAANLSGVVAIGIALGAAAAARYVHLHTVNRALPAGLLIGLLIVVFAHITNMPGAVILLVLIGACGGFYVVPLNALLQERGHQTVGSGHAIAVQNFFENFSMMLMVGIYVLMTSAGLSAVSAATGFGMLVTLAIGLLSWVRIRQVK